MRYFRKYLSIALLGVWAFAVGAAYAATDFLAQGGDWLDDSGKTVKLASWRGRQVILAMEYSNCRFLCSIALKKLKEIQDEADRRQLPLEFVIVSLDPANDTPAAWRDYRRTRRLPYSNWHFLTGSRILTDRMIAAMGVNWWVYDGHIMHDLKIFRLTSDGVAVATMQAFDMSAAEFLTAR